MEYLRRTWADVDLDAVRHNFLAVKKMLTPACQTMAVVKADAYGHGDGAVARALQKAGVDWFAVSNWNEALSLRRQEIDAPILILGVTPPSLARELAESSVTQAVFSPEYAEELSMQAERAGVIVNCHIKVDTGMSRIGFFAQNDHELDAAEQIAEVCTLPGLACTGIFTHFACADEFDPDSRTFTDQQFDTFMQTIAELEREGIVFPLRHCCNSAAAMDRKEMQLDMVRLGIVLYGLEPSADCAGLCDLRPAMSLYSTVSMVKSLEPGVAVGYGREYVTGEGRRTIATVSVGYADGYRRNLGKIARVIVAGGYGPVVGRVCMDQLMIDVTDLPEVHAGDVVTLVGWCDEKSVTLDDLAEWSGTNNYEEACLIGRRVPRVYIEDGQETAAIDYVIASV